MKYLKATEAMDEINWAPCMEDKELEKFVNFYVEEEDKFWSNPNVREIIEKNIARHGKALDTAIDTLQAAWASEDYEKAGLAYGEMWSYVYGK